MNQHPQQRVGVFIDVQNMYHSGRHLFNAKVNFGQILKTAVADRQLIRAFGYVSVTQSQEEQAFFEALHKQGFEVKMKDLQVFPDGTKKGNWDIGMCMDCVRLSTKLDVVVLVTGDGDFIPLVEYLRNQGLKVELVSFRKSTSAGLVEEVDQFIDIGQDLRKFLIKSRSINNSKQHKNDL